MCRVRLISVASPKENRDSGFRLLSEGAKLCSCCLAPLLMIICLKGQSDMTCRRHRPQSACRDSWTQQQCYLASKTVLQLPP